MVDSEKKLVTIAELKNVNEYFVDLPENLDDENEKIKELIKQNNPKQPVQIKYLVFTLDWEQDLGETRFLNEKLDEIGFICIEDFKKKFQTNSATLFSSPSAETSK